MKFALRNMHMINDFQEGYARLSQGNQIEELDYHVHNSLLYHLGKLCIPRG